MSVAFEGRHAIQPKAVRELPSRVNQLGLNLEAERRGSREQMDDGRDATDSGAHVDEVVCLGHASEIDRAQNGIDRTRKIRNCATWKGRAVIGHFGEPEQLIDPGVTIARWNLIQRAANDRGRRFALEHEPANRVSVLHEEAVYW